jgi:hypothetical protein
VEIYTIGFTQTTAEDFFGRLKSAGVRRRPSALLDIGDVTANGQPPETEDRMSPTCASSRLTTHRTEPTLSPTSTRARAVAWRCS